MAQQGRLYIENRVCGGIRLALEYPPGKIRYIVGILHTEALDLRLAMGRNWTHGEPRSILVEVEEVEAWVVDKGPIR